MFYLNMVIDNSRESWKLTEAKYNGKGRVMTWVEI